MPSRVAVTMVISCVKVKLQIDDLKFSPVVGTREERKQFSNFTKISYWILEYLFA